MGINQNCLDDDGKCRKVGQAWKYNGVGNTLGSKVIETLTGEALPLAFQHHLLDPLGCTGTEVRGSHARRRLQHSA